MVPTAGEEGKQQREQRITGCLKANCGGTPGTVVYEVESPTLFVNALESFAANTEGWGGGMPSWHHGCCSFCWQSEELLLGKKD